MIAVALYILFGFVWWAWCTSALWWHRGPGDMRAALRAVPHVWIGWPIDLSLHVARWLS